MAGLQVFEEILGILGFIVRFLGFLVIGFGIIRFVLDNYKLGEWQVKIALALGYFALLAALTHYSSPGSAGAFALGGGIALLMAGMPKKTEDEEESK
jgi:hypothetical protein